MPVTLDVRGESRQTPPTQIKAKRPGSDIQTRNRDWVRFVNVPLVMGTSGETKVVGDIYLYLLHEELKEAEAVSFSPRRVEYRQKWLRDAQRELRRATSPTGGTFSRVTADGCRGFGGF